VKPVQHEHTVEVKIPASTQEKVDKARDHFAKNKQSYLFGLGGVVLGAIATRVFARPSIAVEVVVHND